MPLTICMTTLLRWSQVLQADTKKKPVMIVLPIMMLQLVSSKG